MKTLKLVGLQTYIAPFTKFNVIKKGDVVIVDDVHADRMEQGYEASPDRGIAPHWEVCPDGTRATYDFSTGTAVAPAPAPEPAEPTADEVEAAKRVAAAAAEAHDEEVTARLAAQAEADAANPPPPPVDPVVDPVVAPVVAPVAKAKPTQRVARKPATK